jgi:hypothetical protein
MTSHSGGAEVHQVTPMQTWWEMVAALSRSPEWETEGEAELVQTHISAVLLGRDKVLKLKKPVDFGFLDYTTIEKRRKACRDEVRLNRRMCDETYLGVQPVVAVNGAPRLAGDGPVMDYGVLMRRLPADRMLDAMVRQRTVTEAVIQRVAKRLHEFHRTAGRGAAAKKWGTWDQIRGNWLENFEQTEAYRGRTISAAAFEAIRGWVEGQLGRRRDEFERRVRENRILDGHGDLRCESICITNGICIFDCIEFNDRLRCCDPASEVAFLAMDLDARGRPDLGYYFCEEYERLAEDTGLFHLLPFYRCYRAYVRGKVLSFRLDEPEFTPAEKELARSRASVFFDLAQRYASPLPANVLIVVCGLSGTGKTSLARAIAGEFGLRAVSTDAVRQQLFGAEKRPAAFGQGVYSSEAGAQTYEAAIAKGCRFAKEIGGAVLDGTFLNAAHRDMLKQAAARAGCAVRWIDCVLPEEATRQRMEQRQLRKDGLSDANWEVHVRQLAGMTQPCPPPEPGRLTVDTSASYESCARLATDWLRQELAHTR